MGLWSQYFFLKIFLNWLPHGLIDFLYNIVRSALGCYCSMLFIILFIFIFLIILGLRRAAMRRRSFSIIYELFRQIFKHTRNKKESFTIAWC